MARVIITEYKAKQLIVGAAYTGLSASSQSCAEDLSSLDASHTYTVKVDQGEKKRFKRGLMKLDVTNEDVCDVVAEIAQKGYDSFLVETYVTHDADQERYFSLEQIREGWRILYAAEGGINVEDAGRAEKYIVRHDAVENDCQYVADKTGIPHDFLVSTISAAQENNFTFVEINPLVLGGPVPLLLDCAVRVDSEASPVPGSWSASDVVTKSTLHPSEEKIAALDSTTPASLKLSVLNPEGSLFFLLSSGGASIVNADYAYAKGLSDEIANYGEYSGAPTREETYLYATEILSLMMQSPKEKKALVISGGVANFTDVLQTFLGIIDALEECRDELQRQGIKVFVRRGGPHEKKGLSEMEKFLTKYDLCGVVYGSETSLEKATEDAVAFLKTEKR